MRRPMMCPWDDNLPCDMLDFSCCERCCFYGEPTDDSVSCPGMREDEDDCK